MEEFDPEQLEDVFDTLDVDRNGYLTLNEARTKEIILAMISK